MPWSSQKINNGGASSGPGAVGDIGHKVFVCAYSDQQHFSYLDGSGNVQDAWWGTKQWHLQQINAGTGPTVPTEYVATPDAPVAAGNLFVSVYNDQHHFSYLDAKGNIQDCWYDGKGTWKLQQINAGTGPTVPTEYVATPDAPVAAGNLFVSVYNDQHHFSYLDAKGNIQDCWYDGKGTWKLQQINAGTGPTVPTEYVATPDAPVAAGNLFVSVYNDQHHFSYLDAKGNIQDCWYDGKGTWKLQQINAGTGPTVPTEYVATPDAPVAAGNLFVSVYNDQHHFSYLDAKGNIQDCWYDGKGTWKLQQINAGTGPTVPTEYVATPDAPVAAGNLFVSVYNDQHHFSYLDAKGNIQDCWYDGRQWRLQKINNGGMTTGPSAVGDVFVCVYNRQHHFAYSDAEGNIWDSWWDVPEMPVGVVEVVLPNGRVAFVQAADLDEGGGHAAAKVGRKDIFESKDLSGTLEGIAWAVRSGVEKVKPSKTTVELGIQLAVQNGKLTGLIVEGKAEASLKVTFEWSTEPSAEGPPPEAESEPA